MKTIIIEDNEIELENLLILLEKFDSFEVVETASTIEDGIKLANNQRPELIMLDIQLECQNSLDHIDQLDFTPYIICSTLYTQHALQAFEVGVTDYLIKPITHEKLHRALNRLPRSLNMNRTAETLLLNNGKTSQMVPIKDVIQIVADGDYTSALDVKNTKFLCSRKMREWAELLPDSLFISIDRSTIINRNKIASFSQLDANRSAKITFHNGHTLNIGPTALRRLKSILNG